MIDEVAALAKIANKEGGTGQGGEVATLTLDMEDRKAVDELLARIPEGFKKIDILVNNAGELCVGWRGGGELMDAAGMVYGTEKVGEIAESDIETMFSEWGVQGRQRGELTRLAQTPTSSD